MPDAPTGRLVPDGGPGFRLVSGPGTSAPTRRRPHRGDRPVSTRVVDARGRRAWSTRVVDARGRRAWSTRVV
ncbi:hypothetical protein ABZ491_11145, partial [Micromonospora rifamycinica]|uniref:hypothetical protein n=1 Tax=Micromonospora rifamycinica TaxID=291594 RepID=UPI0033FD37C3